MTRRIKVLSLVHNLFFGGDQTRLLAFAKTYDRDRFEHHVASIHLPDPKYTGRYGSMRPEFADAGIDVIELGRKHNATNRTSLRPDHVIATTRSLSQLLTKLKRLIRQHQIDIIDARLSSPIFIGAILAKLCRIRSVGTTYSIESNRTLMQRLVMQASFAMSDAIITDSEVWKNRIAKAVKLPARVENIPNGIFRPHSERPANDTREFFDIPSNPDVRIVCQISRLIEYKGHRFLLQAAQRVLQKFPNTFFLLVGHEHGENYRNDLLQLADHLGIKSRVRIAGYSGPIGDVWNITHVHAHASLLDSSPNAIIEGMSFGKPAVVTNVGGIPELVLNERTGIVVPTRDDEALSNGICMMLERPTVASRYGDLALERYRSRHTPEAMTRAHEDLFEELCKV